MRNQKNRCRRGWNLRNHWSCLNRRWYSVNRCGPTRFLYRRTWPHQYQSLRHRKTPQVRPRRQRDRQLYLGGRNLVEYLDPTRAIPTSNVLLRDEVLKCLFVDRKLPPEVDNRLEELLILGILEAYEVHGQLGGDPGDLELRKLSELVRRQDLLMPVVGCKHGHLGGIDGLRDRVVEALGRRLGQGVQEVPGERDA